VPGVLGALKSNVNSSGGWDLERSTPREKGVVCPAGWSVWGGGGSQCSWETFVAV